jgi:hypothetical protein
VRKELAIIMNNTTVLYIGIILLITLIIVFFSIFLYIISVRREVAEVLSRTASDITSRSVSDECVSGGGESPGRELSTAECHHDVDIFKAYSDIGDNMKALKKKYELDSITLASEDGLVIASSDLEGSRLAAEYSQIMKKLQEPVDCRIHLLKMHYRGSPLIMIIRTEKPLPPVWLSSIEDDVRKILNMWL